MWISGHQSSTSSGADARFPAVQFAPAAMSRSASNEVVIPRQRAPAALAAATPETASSMTRQAPGSRPSPAACRQEDIGGRLLADDVLTDHHRVEGAGREAELTEVALDLHAIGARGHR